MKTEKQEKRVTKSLLILASASPRRRDIFAAHGHSPLIIPSDVDECLPAGADYSPEETALYLAELKASAVANEIGRAMHDPAIARGSQEQGLEGAPEHRAAPRLIVLGVDTIVFRDVIIEKPTDEDDALRILRALSDGTHTVISGVCAVFMDPIPPAQEGFRETARDAEVRSQASSRFKEVDRCRFFDTTEVTFGAYSDEEILEYVRNEQPYDKSGSYAIQSTWGRHVLSLNGSVENVIGLPYEKIKETVVLP